MNKIALVTGANKGIGYTTVKMLAEQGMTVLLGSRDEQRGQQAAQQLAQQGLDVHYLHLDMEDSSSFTSAYSYIADTYGKLDILINNAGVQIESDTWQTNTTESIPMEILRKTFDINFFGMVELTQKLLPLIRKSEAGRIVNLTSILGSLEFHATPGSNTYNTKTFAYNTSKTAVNSFTIHLAHLLKDTNIRVNAAHPGWVQTDMGGKGAHLTPEQGASTSIMLALIDDDGHHGSYLHNDSILPW
ncbi:MAG TPA: SDR family oxidoreductase [Candidatus Kapabacteria bacterium]|jgi:NAD(P)-dependent dehydrogenase (short-subunit alcohol dehydrogenase family)|nr:SDR family oxidoreductase [Ignavibacteria bacterium]MBN8574608.1 SDR family oxidoreductase [Candidatus Kapabacteria bacterium]HRE58759.1 SDR family oxidoreductase [Candidatus Kapabacteria bacterium]HRK58872.1 SDR family oxidoreductase [Candidatus Kapabacteria bacterium]